MREGEKVPRRQKAQEILADLALRLAADKLQPPRGVCHDNCQGRNDTVLKANGPS